jgi:oligoribonuclease NrnB/cAMP/cGMP phosphodiesterase (DHH superfamily)
MRILTRGDMDGLTSAVLLTLVERIGEIRFAHPKDVQDGKVPCTEEDIVVNLPYVSGCGVWFDHHVTEGERGAAPAGFRGSFAVAPSTARVIYDFYKDKRDKFAQFKELLEATDKVDSGQLSQEEITVPRGWVLLGLTLDPRTGLGPEFRKYFRWLVEYVKEVPIDKILQHREVAKRCERVLQEQAEFKQFLKKHATRENNVIVTDLRGVKGVPVGNRFLVYTMYPECNVEMRIFAGLGDSTVVAVGKSIFNRTCRVNVGELCAGYGGGGHANAATCQLAPEVAAEAIEKIKAVLTRNEG